MSRFVLTAQLQLQAPTNVAQVVRQIQSQLNNVNVNVQVQNAGQAQRQLNNVTTATNNAATAADRMARAFGTSVRRFAAFGIATRAVSLFTSTLSSAIKEAIAFDQELVKVIQVSGATRAELDGLVSAVTRLSTSLGVSSRDVLEAGKTLVQAGVSFDDARIALDALAKSALAPNFDSLSETTEGAVAILAQFKQGVGALEGQLSSVNAVAGAFAVEASDLIDVVRRAGGVFKSSGGSLNELLALFTSVRATTRESAESIGTGLRTIFTRIQRPKTIEFLKQFGVQLTDLNGRFVGPFEAVRRLSDALAGLGEGDITFIRIAEELGGFRQIGKVLPLLQEFQTAQEALNVAQNAGNGLTKDALTAQQALAIRITKVKEEFLALARSITETTTFQVFANTALNLASALIKLADALKPIIPLLTVVAGIRLARGFGNLAGNFLGGITGTRTFNKGGKVHHFARGGIVPGTGNRDTVPAMLTPGEFVIRKSSVEKLGASNLAAMNDNKYAVGGKISRKVEFERGVGPSPFPAAKSNRLGQEVYALQKSSGLTPGEFEMAKRFADTNGYSLQEFKQYLAKRAQEKRNKSGLKTNTNDLLATLKGGEPPALSPENERLRVMLGGDPQKFAKGGFVPIKISQDSASKPIIGQIAPTGRPSIEQTKNVRTTLGDVGLAPKRGENAKTEARLTANVKNITLGEESGPFSYDEIVKPGLQFIDEDIKQSLSNIGIKKQSAKITNDKAAQNVISGFAFETFAANIIGKSAEGGSSDFDFINPSSRLSDFTKTDPLPKLLDAKNTLLPAASIAKKAFGYKKRNPQSIAFERMQTGGNVQKFADGGLVSSKNIGAAILENVGFDTSNTVKVTRTDIESKLPKTLKLTDNYPIKSQKSFTLEREGLSGNTYNEFSRILRDNLVKVAENSASSLANDLGLAGARTSIPAGDVNNFLRGINDGSIGNLFEDTLKVLSGSPFSTEPQRAFDFNTGISNVLRDDYKNITSQYVDAKSSLAQSTPSKFQIKAANALAQEAITNKFVRQETSEELNTRQSAERKAALSKFKITKKFFGGVIQKFARGGIAEAPLVDDILQAPGSILPKPSSAIQSLIKAGGGAIDIDRTLKRTIGDKAYAKAPTAGAKQAALDTFFNDESRRLQDIKSAPLTQFGKELQIAIKSRQINPNRLSIISKSRRVRGVDQYLSRLFGIPVSNMIFTQGGSKEPALSALRTKGPRSNRVPFATGGGVGSDSVPALLTPGEFVVNRKSAQSIGYGNLNRMNKVGKYANGGVVQRFANGTGPTGVPRRAPYQAPTNVPSMSPPTQQMQQFAQAVTTATTNVQQNAQATNTATQANNNARQSTSNAGLALSLLPAAVQSILPPIDESSGALVRLANASLNMITMLGSAVFALEAFGVSLTTSSVLQFLSGKGLSPGAFQGLFNTVASIANPALARGVTSFIAGLTSVAGPLTLAVGGFFAVKTVLDSVSESLYNFEARLKSATESGNVGGAGQLASEQVRSRNENLRTTFRLIGLSIGAATGGFLGGGVPGALIGGAIGDEIGNRLADVFSDSELAADTAARSAAQLVVTQNALTKASEQSAKAMSDLNRGAITANEALKATAQASQEVINLRKETEIANEATALDRDSPFVAGLRNVFTIGGLLGESPAARNSRIDNEIDNRNKAVKKAEEDTIKQAQPQLQAVARQTAAESGDFNAYLQRINFADPALYEILIRQGTDKLEKQFNNISAEVKRSQEAFKAMNLGLQGVSAAANAGVIGLNNYLAAQEFGNNAASNAIAVLEASITSAAQGISDSDFGEALNTASETLLELGATPQQVAQVQNNIRAVNTAQKQFPSALSALKKTFDEETAQGLQRGQDPTRQKELIGRILDQQLSDAGISEEARAAFKAQFANLKLDDTAINQLLAGDLSALEGLLDKIGKDAFEQIRGPMAARAEADKALAKVLQTKIELENKLISAQRQRLDIELEAAEIAAKYGGPAVTPEIRRQNVIAQANTQAGRSAPALQQGTAAELNRRNTAIETRLQQIANIRAQAAGEGPAAQEARLMLRDSSGVGLAAEQQRLQELAKSDYETTKQLIKLKEDELQLIKEKNKLEQDSIQSLISGDIEKFFEQQAAVGATAAIATGNESLMRAFGASALGAAAQDIQRQQQAGVQTLFGQQLGGANGLTERAFGAAIGARGVQDPRLAAIAAGTTAEEVSLQKDIVDLAGTLTNYGDVLVQSADNELNAANLQLQAAQKQLDAATQRVQGQQAQATNATPLTVEQAALNRLGGLIYASTGKFINFKPRGTDIVPAMLTPGEFVVRREAVQRGNNLSILKAMNRGQSAAPATSNGGVASMASGGVVRYREDGSTGAEQAGGGFGSFIEKLSSFGNALISFNDKFSANIDKLNSTTFNVKLDASNINVNLTGTSFVGKLKDDIQNELLAEIGRRLGNYQAGDGGKLMENKGIVPRST